MSDTTAISITGIVVSGIVGPTVSAYWSDRRSARERKSALADRDLHELRELFADCLKLMIDARLALISIKQSAQKGLLDPADPASHDKATLSKMLEAGKEVSELQKQVIAMQQDYPRLVLMLGTEHPAAKTFLAATESLADTLSAPVDQLNGRMSQGDALAALEAGRKTLSVHIAGFISVCKSVAQREPGL